MSGKLQSDFQSIPLDQIQAAKHQARKAFDEESLQGLAESMKEEGLLQPIVVRKSEASKPTSGKKDTTTSRSRISLTSFELISGERRLRAAKLLGWKTILARMIEVGDEGEAAVKGLVENLQREDLNPIEEAEGFADLQKLDPKAWTQEKIASACGKSRSYVTQSLGMINLPEPIKENVRRRTLTRSHGLELLRLPTKEQQLEVAKQIPDRLTSKETRQLVDAILSGEISKTKKEKEKIHPDNDQLDDPLTPIWQQAMAFLKDGEPEPEIEFKDNRWLISIPNQFQDPKEGMANYLAHLAEGVGKAWREIPKPMDAIPKDLQEKADHLRHPHRTPQTPEEWTELDTLAKQSPEAAYAWLYGPDDPMVKEMAGKTWKDFEIDDPVETIHEVVDTIQVLKGFDKK